MLRYDFSDDKFDDCLGSVGYICCPGKYPDDEYGNAPLQSVTVFVNNKSA